jgi:hypothetical protein
MAGARPLVVRRAWSRPGRAGSRTVNTAGGSLAPGRNVQGPRCRFVGAGRRISTAAWGRRRAQGASRVGSRRPSRRRRDPTRRTGLLGRARRGHRKLLPLVGAGNSADIPHPEAIVLLAPPIAKSRELALRVGPARGVGPTPSGRPTRRIPAGVGALRWPDAPPGLPDVHLRRDRRLLGHRGRDRPRPRSTGSRGDTGGPARGPTEGAGGRDRGVLGRSGRGPGRPTWPTSPPGGRWPGGSMRSA